MKEGKLQCFEIMILLVEKKRKKDVTEVNWQQLVTENVGGRVGGSEGD